MSEGVDILAGRYTNREYTLQGRTAQKRRFSVEGQLLTGGFWDGDRKRALIGLPAAGPMGPTSGEVP
ncbi:hypothetical protein ACFL3S_12915 [Gemmatimonadota bacterium]